MPTATGSSDFISGQCFSSQARLRCVSDGMQSAKVATGSVPMEHHKFDATFRSGCVKIVHYVGNAILFVGNGNRNGWRNPKPAASCLVGTASATE